MMKTLLLASMALIVGACGSDRGTVPFLVESEPVVQPDPVGEQDRTGDGRPDTFLSGVQTWQSVEWDNSSLNTVAAFDLFSYIGVQLFGTTSNVGLIDDLRERNPDIEVCTYIEAHSVQEWEIDNFDQGGTSFAAAWAAHALDHLAWTTENDTFRTFDRNYMIDITGDGAVEGMVEIIRSHREASDNDRPNMALMLDYCTVPQTSWLTGRWAAETHGALDIDRDGVAHLDDLDEQESLRAAYYHLVDEIHRVMPEIRVIANGQLARSDPEFLARIDGMYIEGGFRWGWGQDYFREALVSDGPRNLQAMLAAMRPGGLTVYEWKEDYRVGYAIGMFYDNVVPLMVPGSDRLPIVVEPQPGEWDVGAALGPAVVSGDTLSRDFERGRAVLTIVNGRSPRAFEFTLTRTDGSEFVHFIQ